ncbi:Tetrathionate reductase subunit B precursor [Rubripirellula lacrimiformis]|uniref:Tetrathionate reductase subunit B n=1 Tax=Rubripirellula lacrimiformis TaxID=1930273 RepID=A0A517NHX6_9BACT|nr:TAT-variant-translocated molybdopterin oxidoreductase [Rubripirellula lacrimiformis]QDT06732.1 Tetrathionate reductase subunit B precursor [Rubripirellula lacrimiformis]
MTLNHTEPSSPETTQEKARPQYWRSLSEFRGGEEFEQYLDREFPVAASEFPEGVSRRRWMQLMGASLALVGAAGCRYPEEEILPFVIRPEGRVPGETYSRATNFELAGRVYNLLVTSFDGRPLKIEPNGDHPGGGGTDVFSQASILGLYDPDRARGDAGFLLRRGGENREPLGWDAFESFGQSLVKSAASNAGGSKFAVLMSPTHSPSTVRMLKSLRKKMPKATLCRFDSVSGDAMAQATATVFGKPAKQVLSLDQADVVLTLEADVLGKDKAMITAARSFAKRRDPVAGDMNRLYVVEGGYTGTGASADTRLALQPSQMPAFLAELGRRVEALAGEDQADHSGEGDKPFNELGPAERLERFLDVAAHDIAAAGDKAVVVVGEALGAKAVAAGIRMNQKLGSLGKSQSFMPAVDAELGESVGLKDLVAKINAGDIDSLLILGDNPVFTAPGDVDLAGAIAKVDNSIYLGEYDDETGYACKWSLPLAHPLESWGDVVGDDGHYGVCQPQILPLLGGRTTPEVLAAMLGDGETDAMAIVRRTADELAGSAMSDRQWRSLLHDGYAEGVVVASDLQPQGEGEALTADAPVAVTEPNKDAMEVLFVPADGLYDGRFANNGWLQELPQSLTKMCWDNAAVMSPATARTLGVKHELAAALRVGDAKIELPVYEMPGLAPGVVVATIGYGRTRAGMVGGSLAKDVPIVGIDVSPLRSIDSMQVAYGVEGRPRYEDTEIATTQDHWAIDEGGRNETQQRSFTLVREGTTALLEKVPEFAESKGPHVPKVGRAGSPWDEPINTIQIEKPDLPQWGMSIDLTKCIGCNACVVACQSENNVPIVGREQVLNSREMHWIRIDRYFQGDEDNADVVQEPVACMHCETAPCEQVCPVAATVHTDEGLNAMAYNRCIGTRYCANNCPFKVRRFNYFNYNSDVGVGYGVDAYPSNIESANRKLQALVMNPDVTVRGRGVMEKCTYCVQRIEKGKITARKEDRRIQDGDIVTACQSACPTRAIDFGDIQDPNSVVSKKRADVRSYGMLGQLNVKPRTEYLARVRNTPKRLMTAAQLNDLATLKAPHHGDHDSEGHGHDGHAGHGHDEHGHDEHGHEEHADGDHKE